MLSVSAASIAMQRRKILIVEDDRDIQEILADSLIEEGFQVVLAGDGEAALQHLTHEGNWLILLDFTLPKLSGQDVLRKLTSDHTLAPGSLVILISAFLDRMDSTLLNSRVVSVLPKPFDCNEMLAAVSLFAEQ
jgi:two-component system response regulator VicR